LKPAQGFLNKLSAMTTPAKFTRVARTLRKNDTWAEKLLWK